MTSGNVVRGKVFLDEESSPVDDATLHIVLDETTRADAASHEVARVDLPAVSFSARSPLEFVLAVPELDPNARYEIRGHLDRTGSGTFAAGDQITKESHPVLTRGYSNTVQLRLRTI